MVYFIGKIISGFELTVIHIGILCLESGRSNLPREHAVDIPLPKLLEEQTRTAQSHKKDKDLEPDLWHSPIVLQ
jgi:hypothetical protein